MPHLETLRQNVIELLRGGSAHLPFDDVVRDFPIDRAGERLACAVWIARSDGKLRAERWYQFRRVETGETIFRARTKLVCFALSTGKPARMTDMFAAHYARPDADIAAAAEAMTG